MSASDDGVEERIKEALEHVQTAMAELIAAARVFLDLAEQAWKEPADVVAWATEAANLARAAATAMKPEKEADEARVEHIQVL